MKLIGLTGPAGCGKTTIADHLRDVHGFYHLSFAMPIKEALAAMLGVSIDRLENRQYKDAPLIGIGKSPRQLMQTLGTEWGREIVNPDLWGMLLQRKIDFNLQLAPDQSIVISDVRFENEAKRIRSQGGEIWHITRPRNPHKVNQHKSENLIEYIFGDIHINNIASVNELKNTVDMLLIEEETA